MRNAVTLANVRRYDSSMHGALLKNWRQLAGKTQTQVAVKAGVTLSTVQKIEANKYVPPRHTLKLLAEALGHTLDELDSLIPPDVDDLPVELIVPLPANMRPELRTAIHDLREAGRTDYDIAGLLWASEPGFSNFPAAQNYLAHRKDGALQSALSAAMEAVKSEATLGVILYRLAEEPELVEKVLEILGIAEQRSVDSSVEGSVVDSGGGTRMGFISPQSQQTGFDGGAAGRAGSSSDRRGKPTESK